MALAPFKPAIISSIVIGINYALFTNAVTFGIPAGFDNILALACTYTGPFTILAVFGAVYLNAPTFICG